MNLKIITAVEKKIATKGAQGTLNSSLTKFGKTSSIAKFQKLLSLADLKYIYSLTSTHTHTHIVEGVMDIEGSSHILTMEHENSEIRVWSTMI